MNLKNLPYFIPKGAYSSNVSAPRSFSYFLKTALSRSRSLKSTAPDGTAAAGASFLGIFCRKQLIEDELGAMLFVPERGVGPYEDTLVIDKGF